MARKNGQNGQIELLRREAYERRAALRRTASVLEERLRTRTHQMTSAARRTREKLEGMDAFVHRNRYLVLGGAVGLGLVLAYRRRPRVHRARDLDQAVKFVVQRERSRRSPLRGVLGALTAFAVRQGLAFLTDSLEEVRAEQYLLPPGRPYAE